MKKILALLLVIAAVAIVAQGGFNGVMRWIPFDQLGARRAAENELKEIVTAIQAAAGESGVYPEPGSLAGWLRTRGRSPADPWGSSYYLELSADSIVVASRGPDRRGRTADDLRVARLRHVPAPGVLIVDHQPAPPPSSATGTAKSKALEAAGRR